MMPVIAAFLFCAAALFPADLSILPDDLRMEQGLESGYHLYIRKKAGMSSVLVTESTRDPSGRAASYALRAAEYNPVNGDERRLLNGEFLDPAKKLYSLIDSTTEIHPELGESFHIFIPYVVIYGYDWSRNGEVQIMDGSYLNLRAFEKPYADYTGAYKDNPFILRVLQRPLPGPPEGNYREDTVTVYKEIAKEGGGEVEFSVGSEELVKTIGRIVERTDGRTLDLVLVLDTTSSMEDDIPFLARGLVPLLTEKTKGFARFRFGIVLYKDYFEEYLTKVIPFQETLAPISNLLRGIKVMGGRDIPEAVFEALYVGIHSYGWEADSRMMILVGDAPPHPKPRGNITGEMVYTDAREAGIEIFTIILPQ
jgi:hypothetical protein